MTFGELRVRPLHPDEVDEALTRSIESFGGPNHEPEAHARLSASAEAGELWGVEAPGEGVVAHCAVIEGRHWLLGRPVPCQRLTSVSVAPEHRGRGAGGALVRAMVRRGHDRALGLSILFPATTAMYRGLGWELGGAWERVRVDTRKVPPMGPPLRRVAAPDWDALARCQDAFAARVHGAGDRPAQRWAALRTAAEHVYVLDGSDGLEAYALVRHARRAEDWRYDLAIEDWAALTARGLQAVLGFVGRHGTLTATAVLPGPARSLLGSFLPEQDFRAIADFSWMARGLDPAAAVAARGFPAGLHAEVTLTVADPLLPEAAGPWRLVVRDGRGSLEPAPGAVADARLSARALGPLLTGYRGAGELALAGLAEAAPATLATLDAAFAAPVPRLLDFF